jgi:hypothetical protein
MAETRKILDCRNFPGEKLAQLPFPGRKRKFWSWQCCTPVPCTDTRTLLNFASSSARCSKMKG